MANGLVALDVKQRDIEDVSSILKMAEKALPAKVKIGQERTHLPMTEELLEGIKIRNKRVQSRNLQINEKIKEKLRTEKEKREEAPDGAILEEGNYRIGRLRRQCEQSITYRRGQEELSIKPRTKWFYYYILKEPGKECRISSAFIDDSDGEHVRYFGRDEECIDGEGKEWMKISLITTIIGWPIAFCVVYGLVSELLIEKSWPVWITVLFAVFLWKYILVVVYAPWVLVRGMIWKAKRMKSRKVTTRILEISPEFCLEKFIGILSSKLLRLIYADGTEEIVDIVTCDMAQFLRVHADVVNCEINNWRFVGLKEDSSYMYLNVAYNVVLHKDLGKRIRRKKETILLQLARSLQGIMVADFYHDWSIVRIETH